MVSFLNYQSSPNTVRRSLVMMVVNGDGVSEGGGDAGDTGGDDDGDRMTVSCYRAPGVFRINFHSFESFFSS